MRTSSPLGRTSPCSVGGADGKTAASPGASCATAGSPFGASDARVRNADAADSECSVSGPAVAAVAGPGACNGMPRSNPACEARGRRVRYCGRGSTIRARSRSNELVSDVRSADVAGVSPVPVQMWAGGEPSPGADVARVRLKAQENI